jgi:PIN domain nuclease of toxin-antitoxin system
MALLLDTHVLIWYLSKPQKLSQIAQDAIQTAVSGGEVLYISTMSLVEICYLIERNRIPPAIWDPLLQAVCQPDGEIRAMPITHDIAIALRQISSTLVPEMPDRIIAATALHLNCPLITRDLKIQTLLNIQSIW